MRRGYLVLAIVFIIAAFFTGRFSVKDQHDQELQAIKERGDSLNYELEQSRLREGFLSDELKLAERHEAKLLRAIEAERIQNTKIAEYYAKKINDVSRYTMDMLDSFLLARYPSPGVELRNTFDGRDGGISFPDTTVYFRADGIGLSDWGQWSTLPHGEYVIKDGFYTIVEEADDSFIIDQIRSNESWTIEIEGGEPKITDSRGREIKTDSGSLLRAGGEGFEGERLSPEDQRREKIDRDLEDSRHKIPKPKKRDRHRDRGGNRGNDLSP